MRKWQPTRRDILKAAGAAGASFVVPTRSRGTEVELELPRPAVVDRVVIMEDIQKGERVRRYAVEGLTPDGVWRSLCQGSSIGHKRIQRFDATEVAGLRLRITESITEPQIREFAAYGVV